MNKSLVLLILILATSVAMMSTDMYSPSLAYLPEFFGTDAATVKLTMSLNVLAYAVGTLLYGPLSERYGRRPVLLAGMIAFTIASLLCARVAGIGELIALRIVQGLAAAVEGVVVLAVIHDLFENAERVQALARYGVATAFMPAVAPVLGAWIFVHFDWRAIFDVLFVCALLTSLLAARYLDESIRSKAPALGLRQAASDYRSLLGSWRYLRVVLIGAAGFAFIMAFVTAGPFILIRQHGLPAQAFGWFQGMLVLCFVAGSLLSARAAARWPATALMQLGIGAAMAGTLLLLISVYGGGESPRSLALCLALVALGVGPIFATTPALAMDATPVRAGPAGAMLLALEMGAGALAALAVGIFHDGTTRPFALTCAALALLMLMSLVLRPRPTSPVP